jgi:uncharacterized protein DUF3854
MGDLTPRDFDQHLALSIPPEILDVAGVVRRTRNEAESLLGIRDVASDGIDYQYFFPPLNGHDTGSPIYHRYRQDKPPCDASGKEERKYLVSPGKTYPYVPRGIPSAWFTDKATPVLITEGNKQALAVLRWSLDNNRPLIVIGVNGGWGWMGKVGVGPNEHGEREEVHDILDLLAEVCRGRRIYILYDYDENTNPKVKTARDRLAQRLLQGITVDVRLLHLPPSILDPHHGPDDFLGKFGDRAFADLFEEVEKVRPGLADSVFVDENAAPEIEDMPADCMSGRLGDIYEKYMAGFPRSFGYTALLANASALVQDRAPGVRTNLYVVNVGPSGSGKSESDKWARGLLGVFDTTIIKAYVGSGEQFAVKFGDAQGNTRLYNPDEAAHFLQKAMLEHASFPQLFTRAWGEDQFSMTIGKQKKTEDHGIHMHLSFYGGVVEDHFEDCFTGSSTAGFYQRILFGHGPTKFPYFYQPFPLELNSAEFRVPSAVKVHQSVYEQLQEWGNQDATFRDDNRRLLEVCLRASIIAAAFNQHLTLTAEQLGPMKHMVAYQRRLRATLRPNVGATIEAKITDRLRRHMESLQPGHGITKRKLFKATNIHRLSGLTAERVLKMLVAQGIFAESRGNRTDTTVLSVPQDDQL